jgi:hypothetical protein
MGLKRRVERRLRDAVGVIRDGGRGDCRDHLKEMVLAEAGREESIDASSLRRPRLSIIVFARVDSAANLLSLGLVEPCLPSPGCRSGRSAGVSA